MTDAEYTTMAIVAVRNYLNHDFTDDEITTNYPLAIKLIITNIKNSESMDKSVKSQTQGDRSVTYRDTYTLVDDNVALLLGRPYVRLF